MNNTERVFLHTLPRWCGVTVISIAEVLSDMWIRGENGGRHSGVQFDPDGIGLLRTELKKDFDGAPSAGAFGSGGSIQTVDGLGDAMASFNQKPEQDAAKVLSMLLPKHEARTLAAKSTVAAAQLSTPGSKREGK
jgi:hypothetical protein